MQSSRRCCRSMTSCSEPVAIRRSADAGFLLLEALLSVALVAAVIVAGLVAMSDSSGTEARRQNSMWLSEFARSKLEEYVLTYPLVDRVGTDGGNWHWRIVETEVKQESPGPFDNDIVLHSVAIEVWNTARAGEVWSASSLMARRR